jgi:nitroreductase
MKPKPHFEHPIHEILQKRWSPRAFSQQPVEEKKILILFEAARWAASASNQQPWRFIYATKSDVEHYDKLYQCLDDGNKIWAKTAPLLVLTLVKTHFEHNNKFNKWAFHDLGLAIGNLTTQASVFDLYVHNMAGFSIEMAKKSFNIHPDLEPVTMIAIGYLGNPDQLTDQIKEREITIQQRKPLSEIILE